MGCPRCGGTSREPIAQGFWRCTETISRVVNGPGLIDPSHGPREIILSEHCRTDHHEGQASGGMLCGRCQSTFAIGLCARCKSPVCGDHSSTSRRVRHCLTCDSELHAEATKLEARERAAAQEQARQLCQQWVDAAKTAIASDPPCVAACRVVRAVTPRNIAGLYFSGRAIDQLCEEFQLAAPRTAELAGWFAAEARRRSVQPTTSIRRTKKTLLGYKNYKTPAWRFAYGSQQMSCPRGTRGRGTTVG